MNYGYRPSGQNPGGNGRRPVNKRRQKEPSMLPFACLILVWLFILGVIFLVAQVRKNSDGKNPGETEGSTASSTGDNLISPPGTNGDDGTTTTPETDAPPVTFTEATIVSVGDIIAHMPQIDYAKKAGGGTYDFTNSFKYIKDIVSAADFAVANFETTLAGEDKGYSGFPSFNAPDSILDAIKGAGFDMMLFANNHCYDKNLTGFKRTQEQFESHGLSYVGAKKQPTDKAYKVVELNGIKVGMINYADDLSGGNTERRTINGKAIKDGDLQYMNLYNLSLLNEFYANVESDIAAMRAEGADIIIAYIHWGLEYYITHNSYQEKVAQGLCDLGVDVIIGGHPHVIQDVDVLTSTKSDHSTLCFYSLGNFVSNQNRRTLTDTRNNKYTEGGLLVTLTVRKYSTGKTMVTKAEQTPTFVHRYRSSNGYYAHEIVPLDLAIADPAKYGLTASSFGESNAKEVLKLEEDVLKDVVAAFNSSIVLPVIN